jgi:hypothetical protein
MIGCLVDWLLLLLFLSGMIMFALLDLLPVNLGDPEDDEPGGLFHMIVESIVYLYQQIVAALAPKHAHSAGTPALKGYHSSFLVGFACAYVCAMCSPACPSICAPKSTSVNSLACDRVYAHVDVIAYARVNALVHTPPPLSAHSSTPTPGAYVWITFLLSLRSRTPQARYALKAEGLCRRRRKHLESRIPSLITAPSFGLDLQAATTSHQPARSKDGSGASSTGVATSVSGKTRSTLVCRGGVDAGGVTSSQATVASSSGGLGSGPTEQRVDPWKLLEEYEGEVSLLRVRQFQGADGLPKRSRRRLDYLNNYSRGTQDTSR